MITFSPVRAGDEIGEIFLLTKITLYSISIIIPVLTCLRPPLGERLDEASSGRACSEVQRPDQSSSRRTGSSRDTQTHDML